MTDYLVPPHIEPRCTLAQLDESSRDTPIACPGGYLARAWGEAPWWQAWRGGKDGLLLVGTFDRLDDARKALLP